MGYIAKIKFVVDFVLSRQKVTIICNAANIDHTHDRAFSMEANYRIRGNSKAMDRRPRLAY